MRDAAFNLRVVPQSASRLCRVAVEKAHDSIDEQLVALRK